MPNTESWISTQLARVEEILGEDKDDLDAWVEHLREERETRLSTVLAYAKGLAAFAEWWKQPVNKLTYKDAVAYKTFVRERSKNPQLLLYGPRAYLKWRTCRYDRERLFDRAYLPDVCRGLKLFKTSNGNGESVRDTPVLSIEEVEKLIEVAHGFSFASVGERDTCLVALLYSTGFRQDELVSMRTKDLYIEDGFWWAYCPRSKTKPRRVKVLWGAEYAELAKAHRSHADPDDPLWMGLANRPLQNTDTVLRKIVRASPAKIKEKFARSKKLAHLFRHSRATHLAHEWKDPWMLRDYFGWSSLDMANHYVARTGRMEPAQEIPPAKTTRCPVCDFVSIQAYQFCPQCGGPLSERAKEESPAIAAKLKEMDDTKNRVRQLETLVRTLYEQKAKLA